MEVVAYGSLRSAIGGKTVTIDFDGGTVDDALSVVLDAYPRARGHLFDDDGMLRASVRFHVDGERVHLEDRCPADAELTVFPAMRGGHGESSCRRQGAPEEG